jgi:hypothetical protein
VIEIAVEHGDLPPSLLLEYLQFTYGVTQVTAGAGRPTFARTSSPSPGCSPASRPSHVAPSTQSATSSRATTCSSEGARTCTSQSLKDDLREVFRQAWIRDTR